MCQFVLWMSPILSGRLLGCFSCLPKPQNGRGLRRGVMEVVDEEEEGRRRGVKGQKKQGEGVNGSRGEGWGRRTPPENEWALLCLLALAFACVCVCVCARACVAESGLLEETLTASHASGRQASLIFTAKAENTPLHSWTRCRHQRKKMKLRRFFFRPSHLTGDNIDVVNISTAVCRALIVPTRFVPSNVTHCETNLVLRPFFEEELHFWTDKPKSCVYA